MYTLMEKIPRAAARPDPLSSSHVRTLPDVALRWRLASAVARLASGQLRFVRIFLQCFSGFGACFARHKSGGAVTTLEIQGPVLGSGEDQANAGTKTCIPAHWHRPSNCGLPPEALPEENQCIVGDRNPRGAASKDTDELLLKGPGLLGGPVTSPANHPITSHTLGLHSTPAASSAGRGVAASFARGVSNVEQSDGPAILGLDVNTTG